MPESLLEKRITEMLGSFEIDNESLQLSSSDLSRFESVDDVDLNVINAGTYIFIGSGTQGSLIMRINKNGKPYVNIWLGTQKNIKMPLENFIVYKEKDSDIINCYNRIIKGYSIYLPFAKEVHSSNAISTYAVEDEGKIVTYNEKGFYVPVKDLRIKRN